MAYSINGKVYTDDPMMDEIVYYTKQILQYIVIKDQDMADTMETDFSVKMADCYRTIKKGEMTLIGFPYTEDVLIGYFRDKTTVANPELVGKELYSRVHGVIKTDAQGQKSLMRQFEGLDKDAILKYCCDYFLDHFEETNDYYRMLYGKPPYDTPEEDYITLRRAGYYKLNNKTGLYEYDSRITDYYDPDMFDPDKYLQDYTEDDVLALEDVGILQEIRDKYSGFLYAYLYHIGFRKVDPLESRYAENFTILYMPNVDVLVKNRFVEIYMANRDLYMRMAYQIAFTYGSYYYNEILIIMILCQTYADMIVDTPEWYIRRDIIDLRSARYFLESQGVRFFADIPLKYQILLVKGLNKLIRYKSTSKNIDDILNIFSQDEVTVYKYYLFKNLVTDDFYTEKIVRPKVIVNKEYLEGYDFGDMDDWRDPISSLECADESVRAVIPNYTSTFEFGDDTEGIDPGTFIDKNDTDSYTIKTTTSVDTSEEKYEQKRIITDEFGNQYDLLFVRTPHEECYDDYIMDEINRYGYDDITERDQYWDGPDGHNYVKNLHLQKDFTIEGTKYMSIDYKVDYKEYMKQLCYFVGILFDSSIDLSDIRIPVPSIRAVGSFGIRDLFILLVCLSYAYKGESGKIVFPKALEKNDPKPDYTNYTDIDGGWFFTATQPQPDVPVIPPKIWEFGDDGPYDFFDEDDLSGNNQEYPYPDIYDFGGDNEFELDDNIHTYDFGDLDVKDEEVIEHNEDEVDLFMNYPGPDDIPHTAWMLGYYYDLKSEDPKWRNPRYNWANTDTDYNFGLEGSDSINKTNPRRYFFRLEPPGSELWWKDQDPGKYDIDINGGIPDELFMYRRDVNGGVGHFSVVHHETHYEWMNWNHPELQRAIPGRIYGFNFHADMERIKSKLAIHHSSFDFLKGFSIEDAGVQDYICTDKISTVKDLIHTYENNIACMDALEKVRLNIKSRDEGVTFRYVYNELFTRPFDKEWYSLGNGKYAESYDQLLKYHSGPLYHYYMRIMNMKDGTMKHDAIRDALNDIVATLQYYLKGDNLKYIFDFVPTANMNSIIHYISLEIDFFKSWKVYFLDPTITYDMRNVCKDPDNRMMADGDMLTEIQYQKNWYDSISPADNVTYTLTRFFQDPYIISMNHEIIDIFTHYTEEPNELVYDGKYPNPGIDTGKKEIDDLDRDPDILDGGTVSPNLPRYNTDGGNAAAGIDIFDLDGGSPIDHIDYLSIDGRKVTDIHNELRLNNFEMPTYLVDGGTPTLRRWEKGDESVVNSFDENQVLSTDVRLSGYKYGPPKRHWYFGEDGDYDFFDEEDLSGDNNAYPEPTIFDFGGADRSPNIEANIYNFGDEDNPESNDEEAIMEEYAKDLNYLRTSNISGYHDSNDIRIYDDGLYLEDRGVSYDRYYPIYDQIVFHKGSSLDEFYNFRTKAIQYSDKNYVERAINKLMHDYLYIPKAAVDDARQHYSQNYCISIVNSEIADFTEWMRDITPVAWEYF